MTLHIVQPVLIYSRCIVLGEILSNAMSEDKKPEINRSEYSQNKVCVFLSGTLHVYPARESELCNRFYIQKKYSAKFVAF